jgi:hypothetical protein
MADVKHCTASPINDFEGFLHIFYCRIKNFMGSLTEKLLHQVGWQGQVKNNVNSPHDVRSPDCRVLTQTYSPNFFSFRFWGVGERWFLSLPFVWHILTNKIKTFRQELIIVHFKNIIIEVIQIFFCTRGSMKFLSLSVFLFCGGFIPLMSYKCKIFFWFSRIIISPNNSLCHYYHFWKFLQFMSMNLWDLYL